MAKEKFSRSKPHVNVGTIGHIDHGKTTLTAALAKVQSKQGPREGQGDLVHGHRQGRHDPRRDEDGDDRGGARRVRVAEAPLRARRLPRPRRLHQEHDHRRRADGRRDPRGRALDSVMPQTREHVLLARQVGVSTTSSSSSTSATRSTTPEMLDLVEMEVRELLIEVQVPRRQRPRRSAARRSRRSTATRSGKRRSTSSLDALDSYIPEPVRDIDKPFLMAIEDVFSIKGRGTVATGRIERGIVKVGEEVEIIGFTRHAQDAWSRASRCSASCSTRARRATTSAAPPRHREGRHRARPGAGQARLHHAAQEVRRARSTSSRRKRAAVTRRSSPTTARSSTSARPT